MATPENRKRKRDTLESFFRKKRQLPESTSNIASAPPHSTPIPPQSSNDNVEATTPNASDIPLLIVAPQKAFTKSKTFEKDITVLSMSYIIAENPELKKLIHLIIGIRERDEGDHLTGVLETCARFSVQLASTIDDHWAEATEAIIEFIKTVEKINRVPLNGSVQSLDGLKQMMDDDIAKVKSSHPLVAHDGDFGTSDQTSKVLTAVIGASITFLSVVKDASAVIPVPWVQSIIGGVVGLLNAVKQTRSNYDEMKQIAATAGEFVVSCAVICSNQEPSKELKRALNKFTKALEGIAKDCDELSRLNPFWRCFQQNVQKDTLQGIRTRLNNAIELFQTESQIHMQLDINDLSRKFDYAVLNSLPNHPRYDATGYLDGSRDDVLQYISGWIEKPNETALWIHGAAGLGKSTVGHQLVRLLKEDSRLAGGIFLTNLPKEHPETVIQMISRQLGEMHPRAIANIAEATRKLNGPHSALSDYFTAYIMEPIRHLGYPYQLVVVVDGLEEWTNHESFLAELAHISSSSPVKFILTSRPSYSVERVLNKIAVQPYPLPLVSQEIIERYFHHHFEMINWRARKPDQRTINRLATHAQGLLIWAATVRSLLSHEFDQRYPHQILDDILSSEEKVGCQSGEQLERLYRGAITTLFPTADMQAKLRDFLGGMIVLQEVLPVRNFAQLLGMSDRPAEEIQLRLAAFQTRGQFKHGIIPPAIEQFHISFLQFMESTSTEYNGRSIAISATNAHSMLGNRCLQILSEFLQSHRGQTCTYTELRDVESYSIKYWPLHLSNGSSRFALAPSNTRALADTPEEDMRRWAELFLPCIAARFQDEYNCLDDIPKSKLPYELALIIGDDDVATLSYQLYCLEIAVRLQPNDVDAWTDLGNAYYKLYKLGSNNKSLDEEIDVFNHTLELVLRQSAGHVSLDAADVDVTRDGGGRTDASGTATKGDVLASLGSALYNRFQRRGGSDDLNKAISLSREALAYRPAPHPDRSSSLINLANAVLARFEQEGGANDLNEAISLNREALALRPAPHPDRSSSLNNLASAVLTRFEQEGGANDLNEAISLNREALALRPAPHPDRSQSLNNLANAVLTCFEQEGGANDLDEAISLNREALALRPAPHSDRSSSLNNLASAVLTRFEQEGGANDLNEAISLNREALALWPAPHPDRSLSLNNLANAVLARFEQEGGVNDLNEAISLYQEALALRPAPHPDRSQSLNNLANAVLTRFRQEGGANDLDEAILLRREALVPTPASHPRYSIRLRALTTDLQSRFQISHHPDDLDEVILLHRRILDCTNEDPNRSWSLKELPAALREHYRLMGEQRDLIEATAIDRLTG